MSKVIKQMQMDALKTTFKDVRDMVLLNVVGLDAITENKVRLDLRKKGIRLQMVKNSLARRVFGDLGLQFKSPWEGSTTVAWGGTSIAGLSKELDALIKKQPKQVKAKGAMADGEEIPFQTALTMPTREEAIGKLLGLALAAHGSLLAALKSPVGVLVGQVKSIEETKKDEAVPAPSA
jgi:large subunit ribosomal protein L10